MWRKSCPSCGKKIEKKFNYCPYCGAGFKHKKERDDFGMLGRDDEADFEDEMQLPMGLNKMMNSLMKQLEKQFNNIDMEEGKKGNIKPRGFKIKISSGMPGMSQNPQKKPQNNDNKVKEYRQDISEKELKRRKNLPRKEAESRVRRLPDMLVYELNVPGVKSKKDIVLTKLENSIEVKAYSKDRCYIKTIPLRVEIIGYYIKDNMLVLELKD